MADVALSICWAVLILLGVFALIVIACGIFVIVKLTVECLRDEDGKDHN